MKKLNFVTQTAFDEFTCSKFCFDGFDWNLQSCNLLITCDGNVRCNMEISVATPNTNTIEISSFNVNSNWINSMSTSFRNSSKSGMTTISVGPLLLVAPNFSAYHDFNTWMLYWERRMPVSSFWKKSSMFHSRGSSSLVSRIIDKHFLRFVVQSNRIPWCWWQISMLNNFVPGSQLQNYCPEFHW